MHFLLIAVLVVIGIVLLARTGSDGAGAVGRLGQVIYWAAVGFGLLFVIGGVWSLTDSSNDGSGVVSIVMGGLLWLAGWAIRYVLTGTRSLR